jgi:predicted acyl esterase
LIVYENGAVVELNRVPNDYVAVIADARGTFKSGGTQTSPAQGGDDLFYLIEWAAAQAWSNGNVGMIGVSALAHNQYWVASRLPAPIKATDACL